ncbi:ECF transporter S component [Microbacteriaceae bacterium 4G12]
MPKWYVSSFIIVILLSLGGLAFSSFVTDRYFLWMSFLFLAMTLFPFYIRFERKVFVSREIVLIAVLAAIAAVSRVPFAPLSSVQPTSFVIIVSAIVLGGEAGFMIGATAALVSNMFLGQGPWTPWQMMCWGFMGLSAGMLRHTFLMQTKWGRICFGFIVGFLFGWVMNLWFILGFLRDTTWETFVSAYIASFYFDLAHALSNVFFLGLFSTQWIKVLTRFKLKYGMLDSKLTMKKTI